MVHGEVRRSWAETYARCRRIGHVSWNELLAEGDPEFAWAPPGNEWDAISLNYASGTTGNPKGVVYHHRGAALNAMSNIMTWGMAHHSRYLWTLPMFHCNGWCFPWTIAANAGVCICLRAVRAEPIFRAIRDEKATHFCGAPIVLNMLANAPDELKDFSHTVKVMTAGASPPAAVIEKMEAMGIEVTHVYGLTETYGPSVVCAWKADWNGLPAADRARLKARQGVKNLALAGLMVADPQAAAVNVLELFGIALGAWAMGDAALAAARRLEGGAPGGHLTAKLNLVAFYMASVLPAAQALQKVITEGSASVMNLHASDFLALA